MRAFLLAFFLISSGLHAHADIAFKIITFTPGVSIGDRPVTAGVDVQESDDQLIIPKGGHVGLITAAGRAYKLTKSMTVSKVSAFVQKQLLKEPLRIRSVHYGNADGFANELIVPLAPSNRSTETIEDSVFLFWTARKPEDYFGSSDVPKVRHPGKSFTVQFNNIIDDSIGSFSVNRNWAVLKFPIIDNAILYTITCNAPKATSGQFLIQKANDKTIADIRSQLALLTQSTDQEFLRCAVFDFNNLKLDRNLSLYRILSRGLTTADPVLKKYLSNQISENSLELMDTER